LTSALDGDEWSASLPGRSTPEKGHPVGVPFPQTELKARQIN